MLVPLLLIAAAVPAYFVVTDRPPAVAVPEVVNRDVFSAAAMVRDAKFVLVQRFVDSPMPGGVVLDQRPKSGAQADEGSDMVLTVSRVEATVPRVATYMVEEAKARLARVGFGNVAVTEEDRDDVAPGTVLRSTPEVGSAGGQDRSVHPRRRTRPVREAARRHSRQGRGHRDLDPPEPRPPGPPRDPDQQDRTRGHRDLDQPRCRRVDPTGSFVSYKVSTGPKLVAVPQMTGAPATAAVSELEHRGFTVAVVSVTAAASSRGKVVSQAPNGGTAPEGSTVTLNVGR